MGPVIEGHTQIHHCGPSADGRGGHSQHSDTGRRSLRLPHGARYRFSALVTIPGAYNRLCPLEGASPLVAPLRGITSHSSGASASARSVPSVCRQAVQYCPSATGLAPPLLFPAPRRGLRRPRSGMGLPVGTARTPLPPLRFGPRGLVPLPLRKPLRRPVPPASTEGRQSRSIPHQGGMEHVGHIRSPNSRLHPPPISVEAERYEGFTTPH